MTLRRMLLATLTLAALAAPLRAERTLPASVYLDRLQGMWLGEIIGGAAGAPYEGKYTSRGGNTVTLNWSTILNPAKPWIADDDTVLEYMNLGPVHDYGSPSGAQLKTTWQTYVPSGGLWCANKQGRILMNYGFTPPDTGSLRNNVNWNFIDSQITTEALGAAAPGMRQRAADLAGAYGSVTNSGYALHAAQFYAAMYAAAPLETDVEAVVAKGLEVVPTSSRSHEVIQDVVNWYLADKSNWRNTQEKIYDNYVAAAGSHNRYLGWVESTVNLAMTTMAILYGQGELNPTVEIAVNGGFDSDCNPATAAGLVGLMKGYSGLPAGVTSAASNTYQFGTLLQNMPTSTTITQMAAYVQAAAEREIVRMGGYIEGSGPTAVYHLPADMVPQPVEKPDPAGPRGLVRDVRQAGGTVTASASIERHIAGNDPCNLDQIIDGVTDLSYNGHVPYSTYDGANAQPAGGDWYQLNFDRDVKFDSLVFYEGDVLYYINGDPRTGSQPGGYFLNLIVEIGRNGVFAPAGNLVLSEPLDAFAYYQQITMTFDAAVGNAIRIRGDAGGTEQFTTITELEAFGGIPTPVTCSPGAEPLWNNPANWSGGAVPGPQNIAVLGAAASRQITLGQAESALGLDLRAAGWTIDGPGKALTVGAGGIASSGAGTNTVVPTVVLSANSIWTVGADNTLRLTGGIDGADFALAKAGPGTMTTAAITAGSLTHNAGTITVTGKVDVSGAATVGDGTAAATLSAETVSANSLTILRNATVTTTGGKTHTSVLGSLTFDGTADAPLGKLDLADGLLAINYTGDSPLEAVRKAINAAYNSGNWLGNGITSSLLAANPAGKFGIGYVENSAMPVPFDSSKPFGDYAGADLTTVLVRYTLIGDVNLDGIINDTDISLITNQIGQTGTGWLGGDVFGYDNIVNDSDISLTTNNIGQSVGELTGGISELSAVPETATFAGAEASGYITQFSVAPEPATLALLACGAAALLRRRR